MISLCFILVRVDCMIIKIYICHCVIKIFYKKNVFFCFKAKSGSQQAETDSFFLKDVSIQQTCYRYSALPRVALVAAIEYDGVLND